MAYNIVKHRRGTTQEWLEIDLIPENGELIIEECIDGTRRCKIGNGLYKFSNLPYLDDATQAKLLEEIDNLKQEFTDKLNQVDSKLSTQLTEVKQTFAEDIAITKATLNDTINTEVKESAAVLQNKLNNAVNALYEEFQAEVAVVSDRIESTSEELLGTLQTTTKKLESDIDAVSEQAKSALQEAVTGASSTLTTKIENEVTVRSNQVRSLEQSITGVIETIEEQVNPAISKVDKKYEQAITQLDSKHSSISEKLSTDLDAKTAELDKKLVEQDEKFSKALGDKTNEITLAYTTKIEATAQTLQDSIDNLETEQFNAVKETKDALESTISTKEKEWLANLTKLKEDLVAADNTLANTIEDLEKQGKTISADLKTEITTLHEKVAQLSDKDLSLLTELTEYKAVTDKANSDLSAEVKTLSQRHLADYAKVLSELSRIEEASKVADVAITDSMLDAISKIYLELADLVDDDIMILNRVYSLEIRTNDTLENLDKKLTDEMTDISSSLSDRMSASEQMVTSTISELNTRITEELTALNTTLTSDMESLRSSTNIKFRDTQKNFEEIIADIQTLDENTTAKFVETEKAIIQSKEEAIQVAEAAGEQIESLDNRISTVDNKIDVQAKRISNIVALEQGSTTGDAELMDIRNGYNGLTHETAGDAVRAIGNDLEDLKNRLPEFIPDTAVDGLYYDTATSELYLTSKEEPVGDPVIIVSGGGGGGGSTSTVKVQNNLPASTFTVSKGNEALINFTYTSYENEVATGDGTYFITINNKRIDSLSGIVQHNVAKQLNVAEYLNNGTNTIKITCTDQYGAARSLVYNITIIELKITSAFDSTRIFEDDITFRYKVAGQVEKTVHILLDGEEISTKKLTASVHNSETTLNIPKQAHGCHSLVAYMTATLDSDEIISNTLRYEIICVEPEKKDAIITSIFEQKIATQGDLLTIPFQVYDPSLLNVDVDLVVYSQAGGVVEEFSRTAATVGRELSYWNTRQYPTGQAIFELSYTYSYYGETRTIKKTHTLSIEALKVDISPETDGLQVYLSSQGRANTDAASVRDKWTFNSDNPKEPLVTTTFENFNWKTNGWVEDGLGDTCLRLNGDARATINFAPFAKDFKDYGKTLEFEFAVRDVNSRDAIVIDCFDGTRGFRATPDTAFLQSSGPKVTCRFKDEERVRISLTVEHGDSGSRFVSIYLDGILSGVQKYASDVIFSQVNALPITIGSSLCGVDIYAIRVYDKALSTTQILKNYIADKAEPAVKLQLLTDNNITFTEDDAPDPSFVGKISYDKVKALGQIPIITFTGAMPTFKGDKKKNSVYMTFEDPAHPELSFSKDLLKEIDVQGTSSAGYVRKNWKIKFNDKRQHMPGAIPAKVFCIKVDYAEATGTHNTGTANYVETLYDRNQSIIPAQLDNPDIRTTIQGFPCIIFEKATEDSEPVFSSKGNFNYDKGAEDVFGFTDEYADFGVECWEFCNNISDSVSFLGPIPDDWKDDFEPRYTPIKSIDDPEDSIFDDIETLIEARTKAEKGDGIFTEAQQELLSSLQADCIKNFREMHDWVLSTATYKVDSGNRVAIVPKNDAAAAALPDADKYLLETPVEYAMTTYVYDTEEYRLAKFKNEFTDHFDLHYATMYYVFTFFALMVDQRAKNMFLTRWKNSDGKYRWYPYFYDNDTIFGINNVGALVFDYYHEDIDQLESSDVYNGQNSTLWNNFRLCFANEIEALYRTLRSDSKITYETIINQYVTNGSDKWSAAIYNADAEYKYISMARPDENGSFDANNLKQVRGPGEHHLRYFIANRLDYCDSKWYAGSYPSDQIVVRLYTPRTTEITDSMTDEQKAAAEAANARILESQSVVKASSKITVTPFSAMYAGIAYASGTRIQKRLNKGESYEFNAPEGVNTNDAETSIYGASMLSSLGDLSNLYCDYLDLSKAIKLIHLKIGHESPLYHNDNIRSVTLGNNRLLKSLDIRNCSGLGVAGDEKTLDVTGCQNIETIYAEGTNLASISLPIGGYIKTLHLPGSINAIIIRDHQHITDFSIESYENVRTLRIENCPTLDAREMLEACKKDGKYTVEYVYLKGFNWGTKESPVDVNFIKSLFPVFENGKLVSGVLGLTADGKTTTDPAFLDGSCYIAELTGADYAEIKANFPYLKINFGKMTSAVTFKYKDAAETAYEKVIEVEGINSEYATCTVPSLVPEPAWPENDAFTYTLVGWSEMEQESKGTEDSEEDYKAFPDAINGSSLKNIAGDRTLYPVFKAIRKEYEVFFINPTDNSLLQTVVTPYDRDAKYTGPWPIKQDTPNPSLYTFTSWYPDPVKIKGSMTCYAQFTILDDKWYTIGISDITNCVDSSGNIYNGYTLNADNETMSINKCNNKFNAAVRVPTHFKFDNDTVNYKVTSLGGFSEHTMMELMDMPEYLDVIQANCFNNCYNLFELNLPENLKTIGRQAFQGCSKLNDIYIPASVTSIGEAAFANCRLNSITVDSANARYSVIKNCLIDNDTGVLLQGLSTGEIPQDGSITALGKYCFSNTNIISASIPEGIDTISNNAFSRCGALSNVKLPSTLRSLDATCFAWCPSLSVVSLPDGLVNIRTYVFDSCALSTVTIPSTVENVLERSFGDMPTLKTVTFNKRIDSDGNVIVPFIHENAFINSGTLDTPVEFNLPWSADATPNAPWGAVNAKLNFNYEEDTNNA